MRALFFFVLNVFQALFLAFWSAIWMPSAAILATLTLRPDIALWMARNIWSPPLLWACGIRLDVEHPEGIDWSEPRVYVANHQSMIDIPVAIMAIPRNLRFVSKHSLQYVPLLGWYIWAVGMILVNRSVPEKAIASLVKGGKKIREGVSILAFPEGTRSRDGRILPFKKGAFALAIEAGVPVVPIALEGSGTALPSDGFKPRPGVIRVKVGRPIPTTGLGAEDREPLLRQARDAIVAMNLELGGKGGHPEAVAKSGFEGIARPEPARKTGRAA